MLTIAGRVALAIVFILALGLVAVSASASAFSYDGYWWAKQPDSYKLGYVTGYAGAMDEASIGSLVQCTLLAERAFPSTPLDKRKDYCLDSIKGNDFDGVTMGQFVSGVNDFYRDYRNMKLGVGFALQYVRDGVKGKPAADLEIELVEWRRATAEYFQKQEAVK